MENPSAYAHADGGKDIRFFEQCHDCDAEKSTDGTVNERDGGSEQQRSYADSDQRYQNGLRKSHTVQHKHNDDVGKTDFHAGQG